MSNIAITGGATGTGVFSLVAPSTSTNRTITLPDSTGTMATAESTLAQFNATGAAPVYACRAWVNFNGTGTVAIRAAGNVSSITDNGVGDYTVNFATAMPDASYAVQANAEAQSDNSAVHSWSMNVNLYGTRAGFITNLSCRIKATGGVPASALTDTVETHVAIFR